MAKQKTIQIQSSSFLENNPDALHLVYQSYIEAKNGQIAEEASIDSYFKQKNHPRRTISSEKSK